MAAIRFRVHGKRQPLGSTLAGIRYDDLRSILCRAALYSYEALQRDEARLKADPTNRDLHDDVLHDEYLVDLLKQINHTVSAGIRSTWPYELARKKTLAERRAVVMEQRKVRAIVERLLSETRGTHA